MATRRLYRSKNGEILGVCRGIAEWRDYPVDTIRLIVILIAIFTAIAPCLIIYLFLGLILPVNPYDEDDNYERGYRDGHKDGRKEGKKTSRGRTYYYHPEPEDFVSSKTEDAEDAERRKKESDWDNRFSNS